MGARRAGLAAAVGARRLPRRAVGGHARRPPRSPRHRRRGGVPPRPPLRGGATARRPVRVLRRTAATAAGRLVRRRRHRRRSATPSTPTSPGSPRCGGRWQRAVDAPPPARPARRDARPAARRVPSDLPPRRLAVRPHPDAGDRDRAAPRAGRPTTTCTCGCPTPAATSGSALARPRRPGARREDDVSHRRVRHPLLASLGRDQRELQRSLGAGRRGHEVARRPTPPDTLLGWLQSDLRDDAVRPGRPRLRPGRPVGPGAPLPRPGPAGRRCCARCCSGCSQDDPTLEPRDILVMCPDIENYAPLITAAFGLGDVVEGGHPAHRLRVQLADRALVQHQPAAGSRGPAARPRRQPRHRQRRARPRAGRPVRRRFGFVDDDLDTLAGWVRESGVRWGFDAEHREPFGVRYLQNTWRFGIDRVLTGVAHVRRLAGLARHGRSRSTTSAATGSSWPAGSPSSSTGSWRDRRADRHPAAGRLARRAGRRGGRADPGRPRRPVAGRPDAARAGPGRGRRRRARRQPVAAHRRPGDARATTSPGRPTRANFRAGSLTVCTMVPMRSVPHRVVCLLGLDDGIFPRQRHRRRRRRPRAHPGHRRARRPLRGPPAAPRRDRRGDRAAGRHLHRRRRAQRAAAAARRSSR